MPAFVCRPRHEGANRARWRVGVTLVLLCAGVFFAPQRVHADSVDRGSIAFVFENDVFMGTDLNYTNGLMLSYVSPVQAEDALPRRFFRLFASEEPAPETRFGLFLGHSLFTPEDISVSTPLPDQHPYAGWLYGGVSLIAEQERHVDSVSIHAGVVGPAAQGEWAQKKVHELVDTTEPRGWNNQLKNEPGVILTWDRIWRLDAPVARGRIRADVLPSVSLSAGNVLTQAAVGATARLGTDIVGDYGPPRIHPSGTGTGLRATPGRFGGYLFAGGHVRVVAHNIFLDGNTTRSSQSVDRRVLVAEAHGGLVLRCGRYQLGFSGIVRSREFDSQRRTQAFGAVSASVRL
ncbi:MAG: lipid A deacylase LpxR family protein [bacterium]|nr:lipid A deacylase LpxR family protein [bacterium]